LFILIFLWVRSFQAERITKFGAPIENACPNVQLQLTIIGNQLQIENVGNVPVHKIRLFEINTAGTTYLGDEVINVLSGNTETVPFSCSGNLKVIPVLLGVTETGSQAEYICKDKQIIISCSS
jgi:hypothetical protein